MTSVPENTDEEAVARLVRQFEKEPNNLLLRHARGETHRHDSVTWEALTQVFASRGWRLCLMESGRVKIERGGSQPVAPELENITYNEAKEGERGIALTPQETCVLAKLVYRDIVTLREYDPTLNLGPLEELHQKLEGGVNLKPQEQFSDPDTLVTFTLHNSCWISEQTFAYRGEADLKARFLTDRLGKPVDVASWSTGGFKCICLINPYKL